MIYSARMRVFTTGLLAALAASILGAGSAAGAVTFGANLNRAPDVTTTCQDFFYFGDKSTCSAESVNLTTGESAFPPLGEGIVSTVRVRVGPTTGPMQIVVEEALRKDNPNDPGHPTYACCKAIAASAVFTPAANAITAIPVNFRVKQSPAPEESGYYVDDHLSLSVLAPNVPIPAGTDQNAAVCMWFPAWRVGEERAGCYGTSGATVLMNADWDPLGGGGSANAAVALAGAAARVAGGQALIALVCNLTQACDGRLLLQSQQGKVAAAALGNPKRQVTYAKADFSIAPDEKETIEAKLKKAGKRLLKHRKSAKVWLNIQLEDGTAVAPVKVKLKG